MSAAAARLAQPDAPAVWAIVAASAAPAAPAATSVTVEGLAVATSVIGLVPAVAISAAAI